MGRAPLSPALPTQDSLQEMLEESDGLLNAALSYQRSGHVLEGIEFLRRSHVNMVALVRLLRKQREIDRPTVLKKSLAAIAVVKEIALKKAPAKRRRKSEIENQNNSTQCNQAPPEAVTPEPEKDRPFDMPSLM